MFKEVMCELGSEGRGKGSRRRGEGRLCPGRATAPAKPGPEDPAWCTGEVAEALRLEWGEKGDSRT